MIGQSKVDVQTQAIADRLVQLQIERGTMLRQRSTEAASANNADRPLEPAFPFSMNHYVAIRLTFWKHHRRRPSIRSIPAP